MNYTVIYPFSVAKRRYEAGATITPDDRATWLDDKGVSIADAKTAELVAKGSLVEIKPEAPKLIEVAVEDKKADEGEPPKVVDLIAPPKPPRR